MKVNDLYQNSQISEGHYKTYLLFEENELGREWMQKMVACTVRERIPPVGDHAYALYYGRLSLLQDILTLIDQTKEAMERIDDAERREQERRY